MVNATAYRGAVLSRTNRLVASSRAVAGHIDFVDNSDRIDKSSPSRRRFCAVALAGIFKRPFEFLDCKNDKYKQIGHHKK
jgi:hypothetical protein